MPIVSASTSGATVQIQPRRGGRGWLVGTAVALLVILVLGFGALALRSAFAGGGASTVNVAGTETAAAEQALGQIPPTSTSAPQDTPVPTATAVQQVINNPPPPTAVVNNPPPPTATATPNLSVQEINNTDSRIAYSPDCGFNHGLSPSLYNDDVTICQTQGDTFNFTFYGTSIYLITVYYEGKGATISCYIDNSFTYSYNTDSSQGVDSYGLAYGIKLPIAPSLETGQHAASCTQTSATGTYFFIDALLINA
jgi:hypothetical protein